MASVFDASGGRRAEARNGWNEAGRTLRNSTFNLLRMSRLIVNRHWVRNWMLPETAHFVAAAGSLTSSLYLNSSEGAQRSSRMVRFGVSFQVVTRLLARGAV
jgi:hypothetical protein